jgi:hypothetical protein
MSVTIYYKQARPRERRNLEVLMTNSFIDAMERVFSSQPWVLRQEDIPVLKGMSATYNRPDDDPYQRLIKAIEQLGVIEVWPE